MMRILLTLFLSLFLTIGFTACSSSDSEKEQQASDGFEEDDGAESAFADDEGDEEGDEDDDEEGFADSEGGETDGGVFADEDGDGDEDFGDEEVAGGDDAGIFADEGEDDFGGEEIADGDDIFADTDSDSAVADDGNDSLDFPDDSAGTDLADISEEDVLDAAGETSDALSVADAMSMEEPAKPKWVPVKKIKEVPFKRSGALMNRVYIVRPDETLKDISAKIYGSDAREGDLLSWNPYFNRKAPKVGDKVYYESPGSPTDESQILTYYEDNNIQPETYVTKEGDNVRKISKDLLGHNRSWMEVWATNPNVESKGVVEPGLEIKYWPQAVNMAVAGDSGAPGLDDPVDDLGDIGDSDPIDDPLDDKPSGMGGPEDKPVAMNDPLPTPKPLDIPPPKPLDIPPPPTMKKPDPIAGLNKPDTSPKPLDIPPPPKPLDIPPPPKPLDLNQPSALKKPPLPPKPRAKTRSRKRPGSSAAASGGDNTMLYGIIGVVILLALVLFVVMRKRNKKTVDLGQTQV